MGRHVSLAVNILCQNDTPRRESAMLTIGSLDAHPSRQEHDELHPRGCVPVRVAPWLDINDLEPSCLTGIGDPEHRDTGFSTNHPRRQLDVLEV